VNGVDWQTLIDRELFEQFEGSGELPCARDLLATRVPQLCEWCEGRGWLDDLDNDGATVPCPDCPTVERLLAIGAAVMDPQLWLDDAILEWLRSVTP
jgi:hypothetical protein